MAIMSGKPVLTKSNYDFQSEQVREFPRMVIAGISFACNARCIHCIYSKFPGTKRNMAGENLYMPEEIFQKIVIECSRYPWTLLRLVGFGEPMLHPKFIEFVGFAKEHGCNVGIITNGSLLDVEKAKALLATDIDAVDISVDAFSPETYEKIRQGLSFRKLIENVKRFVELRNQMKKKTFIFCSIVEQEAVMHELKEALEFWGEIADKVVSRKFLTFGLFAQDEKRVPYYTNRVPCFLLYDRINIDVNGQIRQCGYDSFGKTDFGNIIDTSISEAWHSGELERIRECHQQRKFAEAGICADCQDWPFHSWDINYMLNAYNKRRG